MRKNGGTRDRNIYSSIESGKCMDAKLKSWEEINEGDEIPAIEKEPTYIQLFMFSAITWNRHLIHYNPEYARHDALPDAAVHRALIGNYLAQLLNDWLGEGGKLTKVEWKVRAPVVAGDRLICKGSVCGKRLEGEKKMVECEIWVEKYGGGIVAPGRGEVIVYS